MCVNVWLCATSLLISEDACGRAGCSKQTPPTERAPAVVHVHITVRACKSKTTESVGPAHVFQPRFRGKREEISLPV